MYSSRLTEVVADLAVDLIEGTIILPNQYFVLCLRIVGTPGPMQAFLTRERKELREIVSDILHDLAAVDAALTAVNSSPLTHDVNELVSPLGLSFIKCVLTRTTDRVSTIRFRPCWMAIVIRQRTSVPKFFAFVCRRIAYSRSGTPDATRNVAHRWPYSNR